MSRITKTIKTAVNNVAKKSAGLEINTASTCIGFQPKEPQSAKKLRKF